MSRFLQGAIIVLFVVVLSFIVGTVSALYASSTEPEPGEFSRCTTDDNFTTCEAVGKGSFLADVFSAAIIPFSSESSFLAGFLNAIYLLVLGFLLATGILLIVVSFIPTTSA